MTDEGLAFHAILARADGTTQTRETDNRAELLDWLAAHQGPADRLIEFGMTARGPAAVTNMLAAFRLGAARMARATSVAIPEEPPS
jgi:hypothetical protein